MIPSRHGETCTSMELDTLRHPSIVRQQQSLPFVLYLSTLGVATGVGIGGLDAWLACAHGFRHRHGRYGASSDDQFPSPFDGHDQNGRVLDDDYGRY